MAELGPRDHGPVHRHLEMEVDSARFGPAQVRQRLGLLSGQVDPRIGQRGHRRHPCGDARGERLAEERAERHVLPRLDVAGAPVVEQDHPEEVVAGLGERHGHTEVRRPSDDEADLGLDVEAGARPERRQRRTRGTVLPAGPDDVGPARDDGAGASVVRDGQVLPRDGQVGTVGAEDLADVRGMVLGGVEVDVVGDLERQMHGHRVERMQVGLDGVAVGLVAEHPGQPLAGGGPGLRPEPEEPVEARAGPRLAGLHPSLLRRGGGVEDVGADANADAWLGPVRLAGCREDAVGERLEAERVGGVEVEPARHTGYDIATEASDYRTVL